MPFQFACNEVWLYSQGIACRATRTPAVPRTREDTRPAQERGLSLPQPLRGASPEHSAGTPSTPRSCPQTALVAPSRPWREAITTPIYREEAPFPGRGLLRSTQ